MGLIYAEIELINGEDLVLERKGYIHADEIKKINISALVDTGAYMLAINENIQEYLQLPVVGNTTAVLANGTKIECKIVAPIDVRFKNRVTTCRALVLPGDLEPLLGAIPLEDMDVWINPLRQRLEINPDHPDMQMTMLK